MPEPFEPLRETLLRSGVAPVYVRRYLRELSEHASDIFDEALRAGCTLDEAKAAARVRLGADEALAGAMLAQPSLRSWTGRAPWATLLIGPVLMLILAWTVAVAGFTLLVGWSPDGHGSRQPPEWLPHAWVAPLGTALLDLVQVGGPLVIAASVALIAARQRSRLIWPAIGCVVVALVGSGLFWDAHWPAIDPRDPLGRVSSSLALGFRGLHQVDHHNSFSLAVWSQGLVLAAFSLALAGAVYGMARWRRPATA